MSAMLDRYIPSFFFLNMKILPEMPNSKIPVWVIISVMAASRSALLGSIENAPMMLNGTITILKEQNIISAMIHPLRKPGTL